MADTTTRKAATKKASPADKTAKKTAKKTPSKAANKTAKKTADKTASNGADESSGSARKSASARAEAPRERRSRSSDTDHSGDSGRATRVAGAARRVVLELTGKPAESVTGLSRTDDGWAVEVEVLELERIPRTTDVLATYEVTVDDDGELQGYSRLRRYVRGSPGDQ